MTTTWISATEIDPYNLLTLRGDRIMNENYARRLYVLEMVRAAMANPWLADGLPASPDMDVYAVLESLSKDGLVVSESKDGSTTRYWKAVRP